MTQIRRSINRIKCYRFSSNWNPNQITNNWEIKIHIRNNPVISTALISVRLFTTSVILIYTIIIRITTRTITNQNTIILARTIMRNSCTFKSIANSFTTYPIVNILYCIFGIILIFFNFFDNSV